MHTRGCTSARMAETDTMVIWEHKASDLRLDVLDLVISIASNTLWTIALPHSVSTHVGSGLVKHVKSPTPQKSRHTDNDMDHAT